MLIKNGNVVIFENDRVVVKNVDIKINGNIIEKIEENISASPEEKCIDATNKIVMPGLINTHAHIAMSIFRGTFEGCDLYTWLNKKIWPIEAKLTEQDIYNASMLSVIEMISTGTTCVNDHYFYSNKIREVLHKSKMRAVITRVLMDSDGEEASRKRIEEFIELLDTGNKQDNLITYTVAPHGLYTCSEKVLSKVRELALKYNLPVHTHFMESSQELEDIKKLHKDEPINVLKKYFEGIHLILAHGVKLTDKDIETLKIMDIGISHNPISNLRLGCKIADISKYKENGILVGIGTDGQGSGNNLDMFEAMKMAVLLQGGIHEDENRINAEEAIKMATINGAKLLGIDDKIGSIEEEKQADIIIVDIEPNLNNIKLVPNNDMLSNLVYNTDGKNVETTIINGEILMEKRKMKFLKEDKIIQNVKKLEKY